VLFVLDGFNTHVTASSIGRALKSRGWTKKTIRCIAKARSADLRLALRTEKALLNGAFTSTRSKRKGQGPSNSL
jgi:hypothetical protein